MENEVSIVMQIEQNKKNIEILGELKKEHDKAIRALTEELNNIEKNIAMYTKVLDTLTNIKENEIREELGEKEEPEQKVVTEEVKTSAWQVFMENKRRKVIAYDEHGNAIAEYASMTEAAKDNKIPMGSITGVMKMDAEKQIAKRGFALRYA